MDSLGQVIAAQASTIAYRDGFLLVALVFVVALLPTRPIGWTGSVPPIVNVDTSRRGDVNRLRSTFGERHEDPGR